MSDLLRWSFDNYLPSNHYLPNLHHPSRWITGVKASAPGQYCKIKCFTHTHTHTHTHKEYMKMLGVVAHTQNPSTWEAEAEVSQVQGQPELEYIVNSRPIWAI
jgi:hypothetical protein